MRFRVNALEKLMEGALVLAATGCIAYSTISISKGNSSFLGLISEYGPIKPKEENIFWVGTMALAGAGLVEYIRRRHYRH